MKSTLTRLCIGRVAAFIAVAIPTPAFAGSVKEVKKKTVMVELEEGETAEKGAELCVFTEAGKKVACGSVAKVKGTEVSLKLKSAKKAAKVKPGMAVKPGEGGAAEGEKAAEGEDGAKDAKGKEAKAGKKKKTPFRIWGLYSPGISTPATFNKLAFQAPTTEAPETLWSADSAMKTALFGFSVTFGIPLGPIALSPGFRYRSYTPSLIDSDYKAQQENPYVRTEQSANAVAFFTDIEYFRKPFGSSLALDMTGGLDVDMSTVNLKVSKLDDSPAGETGPIAKATSKLTVLSVRLGAGFDLLFAKAFGGYFGFNVLVPVAESGRSFSGGVDPAETRDVPEADADLEASLGHKKNSVGIDVGLGLMLAF